MALTITDATDPSVRLCIPRAGPASFLQDNWVQNAGEQFRRLARSGCSNVVETRNYAEDHVVVCFGATVPRDEAVFVVLDVMESVLNANWAAESDKIVEIGKDVPEP